MAGQKVVVYDVATLRQYQSFLVSTAAEIEELYSRLMTATELQNGNWCDPQYDALKSSIESYVSIARAQITHLDNSADYIARLVSKLEAI